MTRAMHLQTVKNKANRKARIKRKFKERAKAPRLDADYVERLWRKFNEERIVRRAAYP